MVANSESYWDNQMVNLSGKRMAAMKVRSMEKKMVVRLEYSKENLTVK